MKCSFTPSPAKTRAEVHLIKQAFKRMRVRTGCLRGLDMLWLEITGKCNLSCNHCYAGSSPQLPLTDGMKVADWCRAIDEARSLGCRQLQFTGGEPTIHPDLWTMIEHAKRARFMSCEVYTNATALREDLLDRFKKHRIRVALSFYCSRPDVHDQITGSKGSFERTVAGIQQLLDRKIRLRTSVVLMRENAQYEKETVAFLEDLGVKNVRSYWVRGVGRGETSVPDGSPMDQLCGQCWRGALCIDPSGDAFPCVFSRFAPVGNFLTDGVKEIVKSHELRAFRREVYLNQQGGNGDNA